MEKMNIAQILSSAKNGDSIMISAWVRTRRSSKNVSFIALNDGSTINNLQAVVDHSIIPESNVEKANTGASVHLKGKIVESQGGKQKFELQVEFIEVIGECDPDVYPLQPKRHSLEFLREIAHLRFRTNTFGAIFRIRHSLIYAIHTFFNQNGFYNIHTPIITGSDAEGAGEMFRVTTLDVKNPPLDENGEVNYKNDFFAKETNLTVSGQLEAELAALALSKVYTFGPTFRAENSNTSRHLAEFWMIEPEMAFFDINDDMDLAESLLKFVCNYVLEKCQEDIAFLDKRFADEEKTKPQNERSELSLIDKIKFIVENDFVRLTYTEAIEILKNSKPNKKKKFKYLIEEWGADLQSEHERYLVEKHFKKPVILTDYPAKIKAFYMKQNDDGKTVRAMDILFPGIGEIVGGSQREENYDKLITRIKDLNIPEKDMWWYLETRKFGTVPHSGFGLGFERLVQFITGMSNIRDVIPFPRTPQNAEF